jgi:hypothetical protein
MTMRTLLILAAIIGFSASAFAQTPAPKIGGKPQAQVKPRAVMGCKLVGTIKGTKLWAGDCGPRQNFGVPHPQPSPPSRRQRQTRIRPLTNSNLPSPHRRLSGVRYCLRPPVAV